MSTQTTPSYPCVGCEVRNEALVSEGYEPNIDAKVHFGDTKTLEISIANTCIYKLGNVGLAGEARFSACRDRLASLEQRSAAMDVRVAALIASGELLIQTQE